MKIFGLTIAKEIYMTIIIVIIAFVLERVIKAIIKRALNPKIKSKKLDERRLNTLKSVLCNLTKYVVWIIAALALLSLYGVNTTALVTGLGVISFVVGLAFQDILKDILAGFSILFERQFEVGDFVKIGDFSGTVIALGLKTTRIQALTGEIKIISNRNITEIINYSLDKMFALVDIGVSYETEIDKAEKVLNVTAASLKEKIPELVDDVELLGVQKLDDSAVVFRLMGKCKPAQHFAAERKMRKEIKNALDKNGIKIPYPQVEVHNEK